MRTERARAPTGDPPQHREPRWHRGVRPFVPSRRAVRRSASFVDILSLLSIATPADTSTLLRALERVHRSALQPRLAEIGINHGADLALAEIASAEGLTHTELAERLRVRPPSVTKILRTLERDGLIFRLSDPDDARVSRIHLTAEGRRIRPALRRAWREAESEALRMLSAAEDDRLRALLARALG